eukprot:14504653-Heterocapsa_arctica.AAC.1
MSALTQRVRLQRVRRTEQSTSDAGALPPYFSVDEAAMLLGTSVSEQRLLLPSLASLALRLPCESLILLPI